MLVSVVIPVYNAEKFLPECLDSILAQTYPQIELVCVDDCSTDRSWDILQEYRQRDARVRTFRLDKNSGSAKYPRDYAISQSKGEWVCNVDADDYIEADYIERMVARQKETAADLILARLLLFDNDSGAFVRSAPAPDFDMNQELPGCDVCGLTLTSWQVSANGMLASKPLWTQSGNFYKADICRMNADELEFREVMFEASHAAFAEARYHYRRHKESITANPLRLYEALQTRWELQEFIRMRCGTACREFQEVLISGVYSVSMVSMILVRMKYPPAGAWDSVRRMYYRVYGRPVLHSSLHWKLKAMMFSPFWLFRLALRMLYRQPQQ